MAQPAAVAVHDPDVLFIVLGRGEGDLAAVGGDGGRVEAAEMGGADGTRVAAVGIDTVELKTAGMTRRENDLLSIGSERGVKAGGGQVCELPQVAAIGVNRANLVNLIHVAGEDDAA